MIKDFQVDELYNTFEFDGIEYGLENDWTKLSWGAWVDFQVLSSENTQQNIHTIMAILYRPIISKGKRENIRFHPTNRLKLMKEQRFLRIFQSNIG